MKHKHQHFVPKCYLKAWCDPRTPSRQTPYVWRFTKDGKQRKKKAPENVFTEGDMYTLPLAEGGRDLRLEHGLRDLEGLFVDVRDRIASTSRISEGDRDVLSAFTAAMWGRTLAMRDRVRKNWQGVLDLMEDMQSELDRDPSARSRYRGLPVDPSESMTIEEVRASIGPAAPHTVLQSLTTLAPMLVRIDLALLTTTSTPGFITSDDPCVWFDPDAHKRPWPHDSPGLAWPRTEITLPLSPSCLLCFNQGGLRGFVSVLERHVDDANRRTRFFCNEFFIVNRDVTREIWFDPGQPPR